MLVVELPIAPPTARRPDRAGAADRGRGDGRRMIDVETLGDGARDGVDGPAVDARELPVLPLRDTVTFPDTLTPLAVGQERSIQLVNDVLAGDRMLVMVGSRTPRRSRPRPDQLYRVGVVGTVARMLKVPDGTLRILVQGGQRVRIEELSRGALPRRAQLRACPTSSRRARS